MFTFHDNIFGEVNGYFHFKANTKTTNHRRRMQKFNLFMHGQNEWIPDPVYPNSDDQTFLYSLFTLNNWIFPYIFKGL